MNRCIPLFSCRYFGLPGGGVIAVSLQGIAQAQVGGKRQLLEPLLLAVIVEGGESGLQFFLQFGIDTTHGKGNLILGEGYQGYAREPQQQCAACHQPPSPRHSTWLLPENFHGLPALSPVLDSGQCTTGAGRCRQQAQWVSGGHTQLVAVG